ncbi:MAG: SGNH/GDSL hydrolase family protein [Ferrimonas sp.]
MPELTTLLLAPLLLLQGKWVRYKQPMLTEAHGTRSGVDGRGKRLSIIIWGDSAAAGVGVTHQRQALSGQLVQQLMVDYQVHWQVLARSGLTTEQAPQLLKQHNGHKVDVVIISLGVNDAKSPISVRRWLLALEHALAAMQAQLQPRLIIMNPLPPLAHFTALPQPLRFWLGWRAQMFNQALMRWSKHQQGLALMQLPSRGAPLAADGFHPSVQAYQLWAEQLSHTIRQHQQG